jgi:predicted secreted protein
MSAHTFVNGFGGTAVFSAATMDVDTWTLSVNGEAVDTTNTGDAGWESNILGAKSFEGSFKTYFDTSAVPTGAAGFTAGARGTITLNVGSSGKTYTGTVQLTQISIENPVKGVVGFSCNFKGSGALTYAS